MELMRNIRTSFERVKQDMNLLKENLSGWIYSLNTRQDNFDNRMRYLEKKIAKLEREQYRSYFEEDGR